MAVKDRIIEIAYKLKDQFTGGVSKLTGSLKKVESQYNATGERIDNITKRIGRSAANIGRVIATGLGVGLTAVGVRLASMTKDIDALAKTSRKLGIPVGELQKLQHAAKLSGVETNQLNTGLQRMTRRIAEAAGGTGVAVSALDDLGISIDDIAGKSPDEQFSIVADAMSKIPDQAERVRIGFKLFDTEGVNLINLMNDGAEGVKRMGDELEKMGGVIDDKTAKAVEDLNDKMTRLGANMDALVLRFGPGVIGVLNQSLEGLGLGAERGIGNIQRELKSLYETRRELLDDINKGPQSRGLWDALLGESFSEKQDQLVVAENRIKELLGEVQRQTRSNEDGKKAADDLTEATKDLGEEAEDTKGKIKDEKDEQIRHNKALDDAKKKVDAYKQAKENANKVKLEFEQFVDDVSGRGKDDPPDFIDASYAKLGAQQALDAGDYDGAIEKARAAAEMVRTIGESGEYSSTEVRGLAKMIGGIATEAANKKAETNLVDTEKDKSEIQQLRELLTNIPANIDNNSLSASIQEAIRTAQAAANQNPIVLRVQTINETVQNGVRSYSDGTDYVESVIAREARKRGNL
ncbi:hypothetical protein [Sedimenticola selenatireducens]|uniref:hypothetical protein n=1 Tax=Sedimenticola selenatireducens TaxID=191960 RepID=UPI002AAA9762|nr:hypothetical protein [Sedimenticola selenatireducens]